MKNISLRKVKVGLAALLLSSGVGARIAHAQAFSHPYDVGMNGGNPGASQWFKLNVDVRPNGVATIRVKVENDTLRGWTGSFRFDFKELTGPDSDRLLFRVDSPTYSICAKPPGAAISKQAQDITVTMPAEIAQRFIAHPSMYGVALTYTGDDWGFCGSGEIVKQIGQAAVAAAAQ